MEVVSTQKFVRMSPKKLRSVVYIIKKLTPVKAVEVLPFVGKAASVPLRKVIMTAIADAKNKGISDGDLVFKEIQIGEGPRLKRGRAVSRGRWHPYMRRMSHIRIVLNAKDQKAKAEENKKEEISSKPFGGKVADAKSQPEKVKNEPKKDSKIKTKVVKKESKK